MWRQSRRQFRLGGEDVSKVRIQSWYTKECEDFVYSFVRSTAPIERVGDEPSGLKSNLAIEMSSLLLEQNSRNVAALTMSVSTVNSAVGLSKGADT